MLALAAAPSLFAADINYAPYYNGPAANKELVQRVIAGFGGEAALRNVHAVRKVASIEETNSQGQKLQTQLEGVAVFPNSLYAKIVLANGSFTAVSTPDMAFMYPANATVAHAALKLNEEEKSTLTRYFYEEPLLILRNRVDPSYLFAIGPTVKLNGVDTATLYVHAVGADLQWFVDANGRVVRSVNGDKVTEFGDWRSVDGVNVPFSVKQTNNGRVTVIRYSTFEFNPQVAQEQFARPTLWMTRNSLPALGRRVSARSSGFGDYVNAYMDDYSDYSGDSFDTYIYSIYVDNY